MYSAKNSSQASPSQENPSPNHEHSDKDSANSRKDSFHYAGFWRRFAASFIDVMLLIGGFIIVGLIFFILIGISLGIKATNEIVANSFLRFLGIVLNWLYFTLLESSSRQATLGKMALGIVVTDLNGSQISFGRANGRYWGKIVSTIILLIGFIMAGFTERKQALHDIMAECLVLKKTD